MANLQIDYAQAAGELVERMPHAEALMDLTVFDAERRFNGLIAWMGGTLNPDTLARVQRDRDLVQRGELLDAATVIAIALEDRTGDHRLHFARPEHRAGILEDLFASRIGRVATGQEVASSVTPRVPRTGPEARIVRGVSAETFVSEMRHPDAPDSLSVWLEVGEGGRASTIPWVDLHSVAMRKRYNIVHPAGTVYWKAFHMYDAILGPLVSGDTQASRHQELLGAIQDSGVIAIDRSSDPYMARVDILDPAKFFELVCDKSLFNKKGFGPGVAYVMAAVAEWQRVTIQAQNQPKQG